MESGLTELLALLINKGLLSEGQISIIIVLIVVFIFRKYISNTSNGNNEQHIENNHSLNEINHRISLMEGELDELLKSVNDFRQMNDVSIYEIKLKLSELDRLSEKVTFIKELIQMKKDHHD